VITLWHNDFQKPKKSWIVLSEKLKAPFSTYVCLKLLNEHSNGATYVKSRKWPLDNDNFYSHSFVLRIMERLSTVTILPLLSLVVTLHILLFYFCCVGFALLFLYINNTQSLPLYTSEQWLQFSSSFLYLPSPSLSLVSYNRCCFHCCLFSVFKKTNL